MIWMSPRDAADLLGISRASLYRFMGNLEAHGLKKARLSSRCIRIEKDSALAAMRSLAAEQTGQVRTRNRTRNRTSA